MFGSDILEVAIGVVFVFLILAIVCSSIREGLESILKTRAAYLQHGIRQLLGDQGPGGLAGQLYAHPIISGLYASGYQPPPTRSALSWLFARGRNLPSYIPSRSFALAVMDLAARGPVDGRDVNRDHVPLTIETLRRNAPNVQNAAVRRVLLTALDSSGNDLENVRRTLQAWYDSSMDRVSGWYKRSTQWIIFGIGLAVAVAMNVDTIEITKFLYTNKAARAAIVADAQVAAADSNYRKVGYAEARAKITDESQLPIGFDKVTRQNLPNHILGWLVTALATTMGAPFWFDLLNKMMVIRSTVKPHEKSPEESSEDRQTGRSGDGDPGDDSSKPRQPAVPMPVPVLASTATGMINPAAPMLALPHDNEIDCCDLPIDTFTSDEDLPPARGGVALA